MYDSAAPVGPGRFGAVRADLAAIFGDDPRFLAFGLALALATLGCVAWRVRPVPEVAEV